MAEASVSLDQAGDAVMALCRDYVAEIEDKIRDDIDASAKVALSDVKANSPRSSASRRHYVTGWVAEEDSDALRGYGVRIHNKVKPGLTHLLEKGHGGPHPAPAYPHIGSAAEVGIAELERRVSSG